MNLIWSKYAPITLHQGCLFASIFRAARILDRETAPKGLIISIAPIVMRLYVRVK